MRIKTAISTAALLLGASTFLATPAVAGDYSVSADYTSEYVFRGFSLGADSVQVGVEGAFGAWTVGAWSSTGTGEESLVNADELDLYVGYGFELDNGVGVDLGATLYHYPQAGDLLEIGADEAGTVEVYGGLGFGGEFEPSLYAYYDLTLEVLTFEGSVSHSIPTGEKSSFDLGASVGTVIPDEGDGYSYGTLSGAISYAVSEDSSVYFGVNGSAASEDTFQDWEDLIGGTNTVESSSFWYGVGLSTSL